MPTDRSDVNTAFGAVLKGAVREQGKTQQGVADQLGQSFATVNRIFGGKRDITVTQFFEIADYIGIAPEDLMDRVMKKLATMSEQLPSLDDKRRARQEEAARFTGEQLDDLHAQGKAVAEVDDERERDEPEPT